MDEQQQYGLTPQGFQRKRMYDILNDMQTKISNDFGFDVRQNEQSYLNVLLVNLADKLSELWEVAEESHNAHYPTTAEGQNLDDVGQLGGSIREPARPTKYMIKVTGKYEIGKDTVYITPDNTEIKTETKPEIKLRPVKSTAFGIDRCNHIVLRPTKNNTTYTVSVNGHPFVRELRSLHWDTEDRIADVRSFLSGLRTEINQVFANSSNIHAAYADYTVSNGKELCLVIYCDEMDEMKISLGMQNENDFDVEYVSCLVEFQTLDNGEFRLNKGSINQISLAPDVINAVENVGEPTLGRLEETDEEFRRSYARKIFIRSRSLLDSITSAIYANVPGVKSLAAFQNDTNEWQGHRPPHSVEVCVDCGTSEYENVAKQILSTKAAGIQTCHCCGIYEDDDGNPMALIGMDAYANISSSKKKKENGYDWVKYDDRWIKAKVQDRVDAEIISVSAKDFEDEKHRLLKKRNGFLVPVEENEPYSAYEVYYTGVNNLDTSAKYDNAVVVHVYDDVYHNTIPVRFTKPVHTRIQIKVEVTANENEPFAPDIFESIKKIVYKKLNDVPAGEDVIPSKWYSDLYREVPGVRNFRVWLHVYDRDELWRPLEHGIAFYEIIHDSNLGEVSRASWAMYETESFRSNPVSHAMGDSLITVAASPSALTEMTNLVASGGSVLPEREALDKALIRSLRYLSGNTAKQKGAHKIYEPYELGWITRWSKRWGEYWKNSDYMAKPYCEEGDIQIIDTYYYNYGTGFMSDRYGNRFGDIQ